jgi:hypothetical protein
MNTYEIPFSVSHHAMKRAVAMGLDGDEVRDAMLRPRSVQPCGAGKEYRQRGKITVVATTEVPATIVTILWSTAAAWRDDAETVRSRGDTDHRSMTRLRLARKAQKQHGGRRGR